MNIGYTPIFYLYAQNILATEGDRVIFFANFKLSPRPQGK